MYLQQQPIPGYWYSNLSGQLIQVRAMLYVSGERNCIVLEDIYGKRDYVSCSSWQGMDLVLHSPAMEQQQAVQHD